MTCQTYNIGGSVVHVNHGPTMEEIVNRVDGETRWCFVCRKHREFRYIVTAPAEPSYYGPNPDVRCGHCKSSDGDLFPGRFREWE